MATIYAHLAHKYYIARGNWNKCNSAKSRAAARSNGTTSDYFDTKITLNQILVRRWDNAANAYFNGTNGISVFASRRTKVTDNTVSSTIPVNDIPNWPSYATGGINIDNTNSALVSCNSIMQVGDQLRFMGTTTAPVIRNNKMQDALRGIYMNTNIGEQPVLTAANPNAVQDNQWINNTIKIQNQCVNATSAIFHYRNTSITPASFIVNNTSSDILEQDCNGILSGQIPVASPTTNPSTAQIECSYLPPLDPSMTALAQEIINEYPDVYGSYSTEEIEKMFVTELEFYKMLKFNRAYMNTHQEYIDFVADKDETDMKKLAELERLANWPMDSIVNDSAKNITYDLQPTRLAEELYKKLYTAMLEVKQFDSETQLSPEAIELLRQVAIECPYTGGNAVYIARGVLRFIGSEYENSFNECELITPPDAQQQARIAQTTTFQNVIVYINNNNTINISTNSNEKVIENYDLVNAMGQIVGNYKFAQGNNSLNLKNSVVNVGVYYLRNTSNNKSIKLMVQN